MTQRCGVTSIRGLAAATILLLGVATQAHAQITGATLSTPQTSLTATCPVDIPFTGSIKGTPGTTFWYKFVRVDHGTLEFSGDHPETMPASGSIAVSDAMTVSASTANSDQIEVTNISGSQSVIVSNDVEYSVTCKFNPGAKPPNQNLKLELTLHPQWTALREYSYTWVGINSDLNEQGTATCPDLCIGWSHFHSGDSFWLRHQNTYDRAFFGYDPVAFKGLNVKLAAVTLTITGGDPACFGRLGRAVLTRFPALKGQTQTFTAPYPSDGDFNWSTPAKFSPTSVVIDVTAIVNGWVSGKMPNQGFVLRGKTEDNGSNGNDSCSLRFGKDAVLTIVQ